MDLRDIERDKLYTLAEVCEAFGLSERSVQRAVSRGDLPARKVARVLVFRGADLLDNLPAARRRADATAD